MNRTIRYATLAVALALGVGSAATIARAAEEIVARAAGVEISRADLERRLTVSRAALDRQWHAHATQTLEQMIVERLFEAEAATRKVSVPDLLRQEVDAKRRAITDAEVDEFIQLNQGRIQPGPDTRARVREGLEKRARDVRHQEFLAGLKSAAKIEILLPQPMPPRVPIGQTGPALGPADARVTIVEFSDFQCPYCKSAQATLKRIREFYGDRVRLVFRDLPLPELHPQAPKAAEAARCAGEQGKYWEYHDVLFAQQDKFAVPDLVRHAGDLGLAIPAFESCLISGRHAEAVAADAAEARNVGVASTPTFFVNGLLLSGAHPFESFKKLIDHELERTTSSR